MESSSVESVGQRLRRLRSERGLSQRELSEPGVSYAYISRIEAGTRQPSVRALRSLSLSSVIAWQVDSTAVACARKSLHNCG